MATQNLATFKYMHPDRLTSPVGALSRWVAFLAVVAGSVTFLAGGAVVVFVISVVVLFATWPKRKLCLGARYLLCGNTVIYYANVKTMVLRPGAHLVLKCVGGESFMLEQNRFPTNARKDDKIKRNKAAKFEKVSNGIIRRVLLAAPSVETSGINRVHLVKEGES